MDDREFIPDKSQQGVWIPNPAYTGNKYELFTHYPVRLLKAFATLKAAQEGKVAWVHRIPSGQLYLSMTAGGQVFHRDAIEGTDFTLLSPGVKPT